MWKLSAESFNSGTWLVDGAWVGYPHSLLWFDPNTIEHLEAQYVHVELTFTWNDSCWKSFK